MKVFIGMPAYGGVSPDTLASVVQLVQAGGALVHSFNVEPYMYVDQARNVLVEKCLATNATHLLFLDSDMIWPKETVSRLLSHNKPVVSGLYFQKEAPFNPVVYDFDKELSPHYWQILPCSLAGMDGAGLGCCLIERSILDKHQSKNSFGWKFRSDQCGEDVEFFRRLYDGHQPKGYLAYLDPTLICGHLGRNIVTDQHWKMYQQMKEGKHELVH